MNKLDEINEQGFIQLDKDQRIVVMKKEQKDWLILEIGRLKEALDIYGKHESGCRYYYVENKCTCGLQQVLKE